MTRRYDHHGRDQFNIEHVEGNVVVQNQAQPVRSRNEQLLLGQVRAEVESRLASSLHNAVLLNLSKEAQPEQVNRPWEREIKIGKKPATAIAADVTILQVFDSPEVAGKLLILGQPGSGKTTTLLDLAKALVERAAEDFSYPIPVLFNLSSWRDDRPAIRDWLVAELQSKYGVSRKLGQAWVDHRQILPLLDGLDEVAPERQERCVQCMNEYFRSENSPLYKVKPTRFGIC